MAYNTRGSRTLVVDGMSFRWRRNPADSQLVVWHVLDAGRLTIRYPDPHFDPTPGFVARVVESALDRGWRTDDHRHIDLSVEEYRAADGYSNRSRSVIALPGLDNLLEHEAAVLQAPDIATALLDADAVLQCVFAPTFTPACTVTLWAEGTAGTAQLIGVPDDTPVQWLAEADPDWIRDAIVSVRSAPPAAAGRIVLDGMPTRVALRDGAGHWTETDNAPEDGTPVRVATLAAWRIAARAFADVLAARDIIEALHPYVDPGTLPLSIDPDGRVVRLFGAWAWPQGEQLVDALSALQGPWIIDARRVSGFAGFTLTALRKHLRARSTPMFWVAEVEQRLPFDPYDTPEAAEMARQRAARDAVDRAIGTFDARWRGMAREALLSTRSDRVERANREAERWRTPAWTLVEGRDVQGIAYDGESWTWLEAPSAPGVVVGERHVWVRTDDGRVLEHPLET